MGLRNAGPEVTANRAGLNIRKELLAFAAARRRALFTTHCDHYRNGRRNKGGSVLIRKLSRAIRNQILLVEQTRYAGEVSSKQHSRADNSVKTANEVKATLQTIFRESFESYARATPLGGRCFLAGITPETGRHSAILRRRYSTWTTTSAEFGEDSRIIEVGYDFHAEFYEKTPYPAVAAIQAALEEIAHRNLKAREAKPAQFIETKFVRQLNESGYIDSLYR